MTLWLAGLTLLVVAHATLACDCPGGWNGRSNAEKFCGAEFVAKVIITSEFGLSPFAGPPALGCYGMAVVAVYKTNEGVELTNGKENLFTPVDAEECGISQTLPRGQYIIAGTIASGYDHDRIMPLVDTCMSVVLDWDQFKAEEDVKNDQDVVEYLEQICSEQ